MLHITDVTYCIYREMDSYQNINKFHSSFIYQCVLVSDPYCQRITHTQLALQSGEVLIYYLLSNYFIDLTISFFSFITEETTSKQNLKLRLKLKVSNYVCFLKNIFNHLFFYRNSKAKPRIIALNQSKKVSACNGRN